MSFAKRTLGSGWFVPAALTLLQFGLMIVFGGGQFVRLTHTTQGVSITWFGSWIPFATIGIVLAYHGYRIRPTLSMAAGVAIYVCWLLIALGNMGVMIVNHSWSWDWTDTLTTVLVAGGVIATRIVAQSKGLIWSDPLVRGWLAIFFKGVPQITMGIKILIVGGAAGLAGTTVLVGHLTVLNRIIQHSLAKRESISDRNRKGLWLGEFGNEASWIFTTIAWLMVR